MTDNKAKVEDLKIMVEQFVHDRDWSQFHRPKNLAMAIAIEAAELMDEFKWNDPDYGGVVDRIEPIADELADVVIYALAFCNRLGVDLSQAIERKIAKNVLKYPADDYRGRF